MMLRVHKLMWHYLAALWPLWTAPLARPWVDEAKAEEEKFIGINPHRRARHLRPTCTCSLSTVWPRFCLMLAKGGVG